MSGNSNGSANPTRLEIGGPRLLDRVHEAIRRRYYSRRTEEAYMHWIRRFIFFNGKRHPEVLGEAEVTAFLNHLAAERQVAAATQNQALSAILFLYREVLGRELPWLDGMHRPSRPPRLPVVLTRAEVERLLAQLTGTRWLIASLLYGAGLRVMECLRLRVKDVDLSYRQVLARDGKGEKDRVTMLPEKHVEPCRARVVLAVSVSLAAPVGGPRGRRGAAPPLVRVGAAVRDQGGGARRQHRQACQLPRAAPLGSGRQQSVKREGALARPFVVLRELRGYTISRCSMPLVMSFSFDSLPCSLMLRRTSLVESAKRSASS